MGNGIVVVGGIDANGSMTDAVYTYSPSTGWVLDLRAPYLSACGGGAVINGKLYVR
ncbi:MAG: hypothetical protein U0163_19255 [Gemmatimonadaceae bacterium]